MKSLANKFLKYLFFIFVLTTSSICSSQDITVEQNFLGMDFYQGEEELSWTDLLKKAKPYQESYDLIKRARSQSILSTVFGLSGAALIAIPIGQTIGEVETTWVLAIVGGALVGVAIPLSTNAERKINEGLSLYNSRTKSSFLSNLETEAIVNTRGIGLRVRF